MSTSYPSSPNDDDDIVRSLLARRTHRADLHRRFPSFDNSSDPPDTPSVYTQFSPRSTYNFHLDSPPPPVPYLDSHQYHYGGHDYPAEYDEDNYPDGDRQTDSVDMADDNVTVHPHLSSHINSLHEDHQQSEHDSSTNDAQALSRNFSLLGPRMKIHSPAPWETELDQQSTVFDDDDAKSIDGRSIFGGKKRNKLKEKSEKALKSISLSAVSPRFARNAHPSVDSSSNFNTKPQHERDPVVLLPSAKASSSTISLTAIPSHPSRTSPTISKSRLRTTSQPACPPDNTSESPQLPLPSHRRQGDDGSSDSNSVGRESSHPNIDSESRHSHQYHPFANPDNLRLANRLSDAISRQPHSPESPILHTSRHNVQGNQRDTLPIPSGDEELVPMRGWGEIPGSPTHNLITLQEAFARTKARTKPSSSQQDAALDGSRHPSKSSLKEQLSAPLPPLPPPSPSQPTRTINKKKSGLLRLFKQEKEREPELERKQTQTFADPQIFKAALREGSLAQPSEVPNPHPHRSTSQPSKTSKRVPVPVIDPTAYTVASKRPLLSLRASNLANETPTLRAGSMERSPSEPAAKSAPPSTTAFPSLSLRPVSTLFSDQFSHHILPISPPSLASATFSSRSSSGSTTLSTPLTSPLPVTPTTRSTTFLNTTSHTDSGSLEQDTISGLKEQALNQKRAWQLHITELERQVKELKEEVEYLRGGEFCESCRRGGKGQGEGRLGVLNRPRGTMASGSRTLFGGGREA